MATRIHQIFYEADQRPILDPALIPYDNTANPRPEWREYHVFRSEWLAGNCRAGDVTGFMSWKFAAKTGITGRAFIDFIERNPGYDVYFVNPYRVEPRTFDNIWQQAEVHHPGIIDLAQRILAATGVEIDLANLEKSPDQVLFCNYWAGTREFWDRYMDFAEQVYWHILDGLDEADRERIWSRADSRIDASYVPFVMERLFSTLLAIRPGVRYLAWNDSANIPVAWPRRLLGLLKVRRRSRHHAP